MKSSSFVCSSFLCTTLLPSFRFFPWSLIYTFCRSLHSGFYNFTLQHRRRPLDPSIISRRSASLSPPSSNLPRCNSVRQPKHSQPTLPIELTKTLTSAITAQDFICVIFKVTRRQCSCRRMQSSVMAHYLDAACHLFMMGIYVAPRAGKVKARDPVSGLSLGLCRPELSHVPVWYEGQWWPLTALCINTQCVRVLSITGEIGSLRWQSNYKSTGTQTTNSFNHFLLSRMFPLRIREGRNNTCMRGCEGVSVCRTNSQGDRPRQHLLSLQKHQQHHGDQRHPVCPEVHRLPSHPWVHLYLKGQRDQQVQDYPTTCKEEGILQTKYLGSFLWARQ